MNQTISCQVSCLNTFVACFFYRASKRMNGEDVYGSKIKVIYSSQMEFRTQSSDQLGPRSSEKQSSIAIETVKSTRFEDHSSVPVVSVGESAPTRSSKICASSSVNSLGKQNAPDSESNPRQQGPMLTQHSSASQSQTTSSSYTSSRDSSPTWAQFVSSFSGIIPPSPSFEI